MKPKLLVTASTFPRWQGDSEPRFILDLCEAMVDYFDITVLVPWVIGSKEYEDIMGIQVIRYHYFPIHSLETLCYPGAIVPRIREKKLRALLVPFLFISLWFNIWKRLSNFDFVHAHWIIPQGIVQSFFKKNYILTGHGADVVSFNKGPLSRIKKRALSNATKVVVVSKHLEDVVKEICPKVETQILSMGCWTTHFDAKYRVKNYFDQGCNKVILFVGRLAEKKGVTYLIKAMDYIDANLVIVGQGPLENSLKNQAQKYGQKIKFLGAKTHEELKTIYASADLFVAPSITAQDGDQEGFGLVMLEAMASGLPVVASRSGGITDIIIDRVNGLLAKEKDAEDLAEKINLILNDQELLQRIKFESINTVKQYDYSVIGKKYAELIKDCMLETK